MKEVMEGEMELVQLVPVMVALVALVVLGLASVGFGADSRDGEGPAILR